MSDPLLPVPLTQARERAIERLSAHFANDDLSLEELERRLEQVYRSTSAGDLELLVAGLGAPVANRSPLASPAARLAPLAPSPLTPSPFVVERERMLAIMGETKRRGVWAVPQHLDVVSVMSDTTIDLSQARLPSGIIEIEVFALMSSCRLVVPPGMRVINHLSAIMASVSISADAELPAGPEAPMVRLTGTAFMAEVKVKVRRES